jgi:hypothetical protein
MQSKTDKNENVLSLLRSFLPAYTDIVESFVINGGWKERRHLYKFRELQNEEAPRLSP